LTGIEHQTADKGTTMVEETTKIITFADKGTLTNTKATDPKTTSKGTLPLLGIPQMHVFNVEK